ncbi:MAG: NTP transferase domain-containing protein [Novosphingobium sp.]|nr:NTP transferase domain-containing protein [Novosphingobium sp.]MBO9601481.1 NTP transferase domain-containing protein [Novosphingobium sp.]
MSGGLAIAVLAAGSASRFGGGKLDADLNGRPLGHYAVAAAQALGRPKIVVGKPIPDFASEALALGEATLLRNKRAGEGMATSVALAAMQAAAAGADALLLLAADMPLVRAETLAALVAATGTRPAAVLHPDGHPGIPACFPPGWYPRLAALEGDRGAGALLRDAQVTLVEVAPDELRDVDTVADLDSLPLSRPR